MSWEKNIYYNPEKFGLTSIRSLVDDGYEKEYASQAASEVIGRILSA
jgi:hypothetical protein